MTVFYAGDVAPKQACALFDVALGEFLFLAQFAEAITNNHGGIIPLEPRMKQADEQGEVQEGQADLPASGETRKVNFVLPEMTLSRIIWFQMHDTVAKVMEAEERL